MSTPGSLTLLRALLLGLLPHPPPGKDDTPPLVPHPRAPKRRPPRLVCGDVVRTPTRIVAIGPDAAQVRMVRLDHSNHCHRRRATLHAGRQHGHLDQQAFRGNIEWLRRIVPNGYRPPRVILRRLGPAMSLKSAAVGIAVARGAWTSSLSLLRFATVARPPQLSGHRSA